MKRHRALWGLLILLPLSLAHQNAPPRVLAVKVGRLGEMGRIYTQDFATPAQLHGFQLIKDGKQGEAQAVFTDDLKTDTTGVAAIGLAQATPPDAWVGQIKTLDAQFSRKQGDVRLGFRLAAWQYYDSIARSQHQAIRNPADQKEFDDAANLFLDLWKRTHDPLTGMMLSEMAFRVKRNDFPRPVAVLETLVGVVGGRTAQAAFQQAKHTGFTVPPPDVAAVPETRRHLLVGVLTALWSEAHHVSGPNLMFNNKGERIDNKGQLIPASKQG